MIVAALLIFGLVLLVVCGELLVRGAVQVASRLGVSPLIIGLTLVGFGTSTPELVTSVQAGLSGSPGIAYGNIVGSNIANIFLILGLAALITPILVSANALKRDSAVMVGVAVLFTCLAWAMPFGVAVGAVFIGLLAAYILFAIWQERRVVGTDHGAVFDKSAAAQIADPALEQGQTRPGSLILSLAIAIAGLVAVIIGGKFLVDGAVQLARGIGISETIIGLTIVALGTSLPELVTSVMAALRKETDMAFGNIVGSNIYNILGIGGVTALIAPSNVPEQIIGFDSLVMIGASAILVFMAASHLQIRRVEGGVLLAGYIGYVAWIWPI